MKKVEAVHSFGNMKLLADSPGMEILRLLMASSATLARAQINGNTILNLPIRGTVKLARADLSKTSWTTDVARSW